MSAAAVFAAELDALGVWWPRGDGDALREAARLWSAVADELEASAFVLDTVAGCVADGHHGAAAVRFAAVWADWTGPEGHLAATVADCRRLAAALADFATDVDVADRAVLLLAEQAFAEIARALTPDQVAAWVAWLTEGAGDEARRLDGRATTCTRALAACAERRPVTPDGPLPPALDPARIDWPEPGTPLDRTAVGTTPIDFGAGQGDLPPELVPEPVVPTPDPSVPDPSVPDPVVPEPVLPPLGGLGSSGGTTIVIVGNSGTISIDVEAPTAAAVPLAPLTSFAPEPFVAAVPDVVPSVPSFDPAPAWTPAPLPEPVPFEPAPVERVPEPVPVTITPPGTSAVTAGVGAVAATAATAAAAEAARKGGGFMPFMPMGGGTTSGDDGPEPRRRVRRPTTTPAA